MKRYFLNSADYIKCIFIDYVLSLKDDIIIGNEIMYGSERRLVDLVILKNGKIAAIEIKSDNDSLRRIKDQITEYKKVFDLVIIVTTEKHLLDIAKNTSEDIGIYLIDQKTNITLFRSPKQQRQLDKSEILNSINARYLKSISSSNIKKLSSDNIRKNLEKASVKKVKLIFYNYLTNKVSSNFQTFLTERGFITHIEDLSVLTSTKNSIE